MIAMVYAVCTYLVCTTRVQDAATKVDQLKALIHKLSEEKKVGALTLTLLDRICKLSYEFPCASPIFLNGVTYIVLKTCVRSYV
jgi:hypothetical protein